MNNATTHPVAPEELMALLDGELPMDRTQSVSAHLEACDECQERATALRSTSQTVSSWTVDPARTRTTFEERLTGTALNLSSEIQFPRGFDLRMFLRRRGMLVAVSVSVLVFLAVSATFRGHDHEFSGFMDSAKRPASKTQQTVSVYSAETDGTRHLRVAEKGKNSIGLTTLALPGMTTDSNGIFHGLGDQAQNSFSVDGQPITGQQSNDFAGPMIARTVSLTVIVKEFDASRRFLDGILSRHNGYAAGLNVSTPQGAARSLTASLRVPAPQLAAAVNELKALGRVENENQNGEEVTQQHADLVARLKNSRETEQRLQAILVQRTGKISDVLSVEQEIARVRGEIEQMEAHQKNLEHRVDFATVDLNLAEEYKAQLNSPAPAVSTQFHNALVSGYTRATESLLGLLLIFVQYSPVLLLWIAILSSPAWLLWRRWKRASAMV